MEGDRRHLARTADTAEIARSVSQGGCRCHCRLGIPLATDLIRKGNSWHILGTTKINGREASKTPLEPLVFPPPASMRPFIFLFLLSFAAYSLYFQHPLAFCKRRHIRSSSFFSASFYLTFFKSGAWNRRKKTSARKFRRSFVHLKKGVGKCYVSRMLSFSPFSSHLFL